MKERPILYSAPMVVAILEGRKSQTRRVIKNIGIAPGIGEIYKGSDDSREWVKECPYGIVGNRLWVRESWRVSSAYDDISPNQLPRDISVEYPATCHIDKLLGRKRPSIHMPRSLSRILTEITGIRVQRLQDITPEEAKAEGLKGISKDGRTVKFGIPDLDGYPGTDNHGWPWHEWEFDPVMAYKRLWEKINSKGSWDKNPWVWVVEFERI